MTETARLLEARMDLAWSEFQYLREAFEALSQEWSNNSVYERQSDRVTYLLKARPGTVDPMLRVRSGTFIHHVRATLDNIAWALAVRVKQDPGKVSFPIARSSGEFHNTKWVRLLGARAKCVVAAEALQPYNRPDARCLVILHRLWNYDKHRIPTVLPVIPAGAVFIWVAGSMAAKKQPVATSYWSRRGKSVKHDAILAKVVVPPNEQQTPQGGVMLRPALDVKGPLADRQLPHAFFQMYEFVRNEVMPALVPLL